MGAAYSTTEAIANGGYLADFSVGASFSPTDWSKKEGFINGSAGIGVGVGAFGGAQYQYTIGAIPIWQWKNRPKYGK